MGQALMSGVRAMKKKADEESHGLLASHHSNVTVSSLIDKINLVHFLDYSIVYWVLSLFCVQHVNPLSFYPSTNSSGAGPAYLGFRLVSA